MKPVLRRPKIALHEIIVYVFIDLFSKPLTLFKNTVLCNFINFIFSQCTILKRTEIYSGIIFKMQIIIFTEIKNVIEI